MDCLPDEPNSAQVRQNNSLCIDVKAITNIAQDRAEGFPNRSSQCVSKPEKENHKIFEEHRDFEGWKKGNQPRQKRQIDQSMKNSAITIVD